MGAEPMRGDVGLVAPVAPVAPAVPRPFGRPSHAEPSDAYRERLEEIVTVAADVFWSAGYEGGSLGAVAERAGLRKASLYHYVDKKSDLLRLVFERAMEMASAQIETITAIEDPGEKLAAWIAYEALLVSQNRAVFGVFFDERNRLEPSDAKKIRRDVHRHVGRFIGVVEEAMDAGVLPRADAKVVANSIMGMTSWSYRWFDPDRDSAQAFAESCVALIARREATSAVPIARPKKS